MNCYPSRGQKKYKVLPVSNRELPQIVRTSPKAPLRRQPSDASCSYTSCCPTEYRLRSAVRRIPDESSVSVQETVRYTNATALSIQPLNDIVATDANPVFDGQSQSVSAFYILKLTASITAQIHSIHIDLRVTPALHKGRFANLQCGHTPLCSVR